MKKIVALVVVASAVGILGGCANMPSFGIAADRVEIVDYRKMQFIEEHAKRNGVTVIWLRQPTKLVDRVVAVN